MTNNTLRESLNADIEQFLNNGGKVSIIQSQKVKRNHMASGHQNLSFGWRQPINRPSNAWDGIQPID